MAELTTEDLLLNIEERYRIQFESYEQVVDNFKWQSDWRDKSVKELHDLAKQTKDIIKQGTTVVDECKKECHTLVAAFRAELKQIADDLRKQMTYDRNLLQKRIREVEKAVKPIANLWSDNIS